MNTINKNKLTIITDNKNWMEGNAINQAKDVAKLDGVVEAFAMPDLHAGKTPVGITVITEGIIYPHLIGTDIGCGMSTYSTDIEVSKLKTDKWVKKLNTIKTLSAVPNENYYPDCPIPDFGSLGAGNHFAEFQVVHKVYDKDALEELGVSIKELLITAHSGSRSYGAKILQNYNSYNGYKADREEAKEYMAVHNDALKWSSLNRDEAVEKIIAYLGFQKKPVKRLESFHNYLEETGGKFYHRKGSVSSNHNAVFIAGSRGTLSYIVRPTTKCAEYGYSLAHGSGRKWARSMCKGRVWNKYDKCSIDIKFNKYQGQLVCHDYDLLFEEAPEAYKNIENIIAILLEYEMVELIASVKPVLTVKA
ncbi:MAG: RNA ligase RtcB family protein [Defluviitaleaceae bacterium]|nr:RNA ligase RtcB family protein [Defluviitaleaceae bacterium]